MKLRKRSAVGFRIDMINVGQGDAFLLVIDGPSGPANILIDAGVKDAGVEVVSYVNSYAPEGLNLIFVTHLDNDHIGGMPTVLERVNLKSYAGLVMNVPPGLEHWRSVEKTLRGSCISQKQAHCRRLGCMLGSPKGCANERHYHRGGSGWKFLAETGEL